ncbi:MAG: hypothetical protein K2L81_05805, partial [Muribaculaceae bacterium]|nr:hypothetical protein [Muribaculaceae bacterium]
YRGSAHRNILIRNVTFCNSFANVELRNFNSSQNHRNGNASMFVYKCLIQMFTLFISAQTSIGLGIYIRGVIFVARS